MCNVLKTLISNNFSETHTSLVFLTPKEIPPSSQQNSTVPPKRPAKLWELSPSYHCSVVGTCLNVKELRQLIRQSGLEIQDQSDYTLHSLFVGHANHVNPLSRLMQKRLDKKYVLYRKRFAPVDNHNLLLHLWNEACKQGDIAGTFWTVMTHPIADETLQHEVYAQVHMLSHQIGALQRANLRELHRLQQCQTEWQLQSKELQKNIQERDQGLQILQKELQEAHLQVMKQELIPRCAPETETLQRALQQAQQENAKLREQLATVRTQNITQQSQLEQLQRCLQQMQGERDVLEQHLEECLTSETCNNCEIAGTTQCPIQDSRCIVYVGGRDRLKPHFRTLMEQRYGGRFLYHNGGLHGKEQTLHQVLCQADIVFCPVDCISHNACRTVKQFCKKYNKPMVWLRTESLSSFTQGLRESLEQEKLKQVISP